MTLLCTSALIGLKHTGLNEYRIIGSRSVIEETILRLQERHGITDFDEVESPFKFFKQHLEIKPELDSRTFLLWATPAIAVFGGFLVVAGVVIRSRRAGPSGPALSTEEKARVDKMLAEQERSS